MMMCSTHERETKDKRVFGEWLAGFRIELGVDKELANDPHIIQILIRRMKHEVEKDSALSLDLFWSLLFGGALSNTYHKIMEHPDGRETRFFRTLVEWQL